MITTMTFLSSLRSSAKPWNDNNDNDYDDDDYDKDVVIARTSKKNNDHDIVFFAPVAVAIVEVDKGVTHPHRCLLTLTPLRRRRGGDPLSSKPWSANNNKDNYASVASTSKNDEDHLRSSLGLRTTVELPAQPEATRQRGGGGGGGGGRGGGGGGGGGGGDKRRHNNQLMRMKWGGKDESVRQRMMRGQADGRGRRANKVEGSRMGNNRGNIRQQE
jgi:hypothetical protein